jgi:hypothetical protein
MTFIRGSGQIRCLDGRESRQSPGASSHLGFREVEKIAIYTSFEKEGFSCQQFEATSPLDPLTVDAALSSVGSSRLNYCCPSFGLVI